MSTHLGKPTKQDILLNKGAGEMRAALVESAWMAVSHSLYWKEQFERFAPRIGKKRAIVSIARKLLGAVWHLLSKQTADLHADQESADQNLETGHEGTRKETALTGMILPLVPALGMSQ